MTEEVYKADLGEVKRFDDLLDYLGNGRWTLLYFLISAIYNASFATQALGGAFSTPIMNYTCRHPTITIHSSEYVEAHNTTIITPIDKCEYLVTPSEGDARVEKCTQWDFDHSTFEDTLTSEMLLVCERSFFMPLYQSVYMFGSVFGASLGGFLSDKLGRYPVFVSGSVMFVLVAAGSAFLSDIFLLLAARAALGFLHMAGIQSGYVLVMETCTNHVRAMAGMLVMLPWAMGIILYGALGYAIRQWRYLQLATSLPFIIMFPALWFLDESPRWLLVQGDVQKAHKVVSKAARWHGVKPPSLATLNLVKDNLLCQKDESAEETGSVCKWLYHRVISLLVLFRNKKLCVLTMVVCFNFFTASLVYFGLSLSAVNFSADPFIYMVLTGLAEVPSYTLTGPILARLGRKGPAIFSFFITGLALIALPFTPIEAGWMKMTLAMVGKVSISSVFVEFFLYASEVFPTEVRLQGLGTGLLFSRLGSIVSPFINDILVPLYPWMTSVMFGGLSMVAAFSTCLLPETRGVRMPDVVGDVEDKCTLTIQEYKADEETKEMDTFIVQA